MPRTKTKKRKSTKLRRARTNRMPLLVGISSKPEYTVEFTNNIEADRFANQALAQTKGVVTFFLSDCMGYNNYTAIFDYYRINWVKVRFVPILTQTVNRPYDDSTSPTGGEIPLFVTGLDRDSTTAPVDLNDMLERGHKKVTSAIKPHTWTFTPNRLVQVYESPTSTGYKIDTDTKSFLDCADPTIPHFGLKWVLGAASPSNAYVYEVRITYNISFQQKRG